MNTVIQPQRGIPYDIRKAVSKELKKLIEQDIIEKVVDHPTHWVSPIVCIPKKDGEHVYVWTCTKQTRQ